MHCIENETILWLILFLVIFISLNRNHSFFIMQTHTQLTQLTRGKVSRFWWIFLRFGSDGGREWKNVEMARFNPKMLNKIYINHLQSCTWTLNIQHFKYSTFWGNLSTKLRPINYNVRLHLKWSHEMDFRTL